MKKWLSAKYRLVEEWLWRLLPFVLFFSYYPVIKLGANEAMNFELSVALIWLGLFGGLSVFRLPKIAKKWGWRKVGLTVILPVYASLSIVWSKNPLRGVLTVGILWLIWFAGANILTRRAKKTELLAFARRLVYGGAIFGVVCLVQCVLDVAGVGKEITQLCAGCGYESLGFPHPNGLAIEPQFMGNLLLAPAILSLFFAYNTINARSSKSAIARSLALSFLIIMSLFVCFSRGAIYSFILSLVFLTVFCAVWKRKEFMRVVIYFAISGLAFGAGLIFQGVMAEFSTTSEGFAQGVARSVHQLSLGKVDFRQKEEAPGEQATFSGYIEESTNIRLDLNTIAIESWRNALLFGVGVGGGGVALSENSDLSAKEIVQNQYLNLLLEWGAVGCICALTSVCALLWIAFKERVAVYFWMILIAFGASIGFFSGLPNALHIYLFLPALARLGVWHKYDKLK